MSKAKQLPLGSTLLEVDAKLPRGAALSKHSRNTLALFKPERVAGMAHHTSTMAA
jgi:hypothetical protein